MKEIEAVMLVQKVMELPEDTVEVVNAVIRSMKENNHILPEVNEDNIDKFNDIFFFNLINAFPERKMINKHEEETGFSFVLYNGVFGLACGKMFYHY